MIASWPPNSAVKIVNVMDLMKGSERGGAQSQKAPSNGFGIGRSLSVDIIN